jgi:predicted nucleic acid-binding protein
MSHAFLDTAYLLALLNPRDTWHARALTLSQRPHSKLVTTEAVLTEIADALCQRARRTWAVQTIDDLRGDRSVRCVGVDSRLFARALDFYRERDDKDWSLTDCISFVVMGDLRLTDALTSDVHFVQAGFRALLRE